MDSLYYQKQIDDYQYIKKVESEQAFLEQQQMLEAMKTPELAETFYAPGQKPVEADAPNYDPKEKAKDKKKRIQRERQHFEKKSAGIMHENDYISNLRDLSQLSPDVYDEFDEQLKYENYSPNYVYENYDEIISQLHRYKAIIMLNRERMENPQDRLIQSVFSKEHEIRMANMQIRYEAAKKAYLSAMRALGYECDGETFRIIKEVSNKERDAALARNIEDREAMRDLGRLDEDADRLIEKSIVDSNKEAHIRAANAAVDEATANIESLKERYPEGYADNQEIVDKIQTDILRISEKIALQQSGDESVRHEIELQNAGQGEAMDELSEKTIEKLEKRLSANSNRTALLEKYVSNLKETISAVLSNGELTQTSRLLLAKYKGETTADKKAVAAARAYDRAVTESISACINKVSDFDSRELEQYSPEELMAHADELAELNKAGIKVMEAAEEDNSIYERLGGRQLTILKSRLIGYYAEKARGLALFGAYNERGLKQSYFTADEQSVMKKRFGIGPGDEIDDAHMYVYMRERLEVGEAAKVQAYNDYFNSEEIEKKYATSREKKQDAFVHKEVINGIYSTNSLTGRPNGAVSMGKNEMRELYNQIYEKLYEGVDKMKDPRKRTNGTHGTVDSYAEKIALRRQLDNIEMYYALTRSNYTTANGESIKEPLFRSFSNVEHMYSFRDMSDDEFFDMCKKLSAGALAEMDKATPEEKESYQRENEEGLQIYKEHMRAHYEMLEKRFHHQVPSLEYMEQHKDELMDLLGNLQVDDNLAEKIFFLKDSDNEEDRYLYHLIQVYYAIASYMKAFEVAAVRQFRDYREAEMVNKGYLEAVQASFDYLNARGRH